MISLSFCGGCRSELDQLDTPEKYPEGFRVTVDVVVSPRDKPPHGQSFPWEGFSTKGLSPKILFSAREEQMETLEEFGRIRCLLTYYLPGFV